MGKSDNLGYQSFEGESPFDVKISDQKKPTLTSSKLNNGVTVVSESTSIPSNIQLGIVMDVGSRDESNKQSGSLHSLMTCFYKSFTNTNETINYGMVQMAGGQFSMNYNRENLWYKGYCLPHDTVDIFQMMSDCALEPRNFNSASVGLSKLPNSLEYLKSSGQWDSFSDKLFLSVYGKSGLGNKVYGEKSNYNNLDSFTLQQFQLDNISSDKISVVGVGVENHGEFHELVQNVMGNLSYNKNDRKRESSKFQENDLRMETFDNQLQFAITFEADNVKSSNLLYFYLLSEMLGKVEVNGLSQNGRFNEKLYRQNKYFNSLESSNQHFSDSGMFVIRGTVSGGHGKQAIESVSKEINDLVSNVNKQEFEITQKSMNLKILNSLNDGQTKVEEYLKQQIQWGNVKGSDLIQEINNLDINKFKKISKTLFSGKMNVLLEGSGVNQVQSYDQIKKMFKK